MIELARHIKETGIMENQKAINCFDCPEFNSLKGSCKRANKKLPCIKQEPVTDAQPKP